MLITLQSILNFIEIRNGLSDVKIKHVGSHKDKSNVGSTCWL